MDLPFSTNFRRRHPKLRAARRRARLRVAFGSAWRTRLGAGLPRRRVSVGRRARRVPAAPDVEALRRRRPLHRRARARAAHALKIDQIPPIVRNAFVITEDKRFYQHAGIDWQRVPGAILDRHQAPQLRRRLLDDHDAARAEHLPRAHLARQVARPQAEGERRSRAPSRRSTPRTRSSSCTSTRSTLGNGAYGVETAAQRYFGKSARDLNVAEAATLAALPKAPERYNPRRFPSAPSSAATRSSS